jgi:hypothetical protein
LRGFLGAFLGLGQSLLLLVGFGRAGGEAQGQQGGGWQQKSGHAWLRRREWLIQASRIEHSQGVNRTAT